MYLIMLLSMINALHSISKRRRSIVEREIADHIKEGGRDAMYVTII